MEKALDALTGGVPCSVGQKPIGQILKELDLVTESRLQEALEIQRRQGGVLGEILVKLGYVAREEVHLALAAQIGMTVIDQSEALPALLDDAFLAMEREEVIFDDVEPDAHSEPVRRLVNLVLVTALTAGATELLVERSLGRIRIRCRVDGILCDMESPPDHLTMSILDRIRRLTRLHDRRSSVTATLAGRRYEVEATDDGVSVVLRFSPAL